MKYKLKKDLPFAKAGQTIAFTPSLLHITTLGIRKNYLFDRDDLNELIKDGWIEEIKPRESWTIKDNNYEFLNQTYLYGSYSEAERAFSLHKLSSPRYEIIKVREVLE